MKLILLSGDLMISSLVAGAVREHSLDVLTVGSQTAAAEAAKAEDVGIIVVDLRTAGLDIQALAEAIRSESEHPPRILAFGPHVHEDRLAAASDAQCDAVVTRGQFDREASQLIGRLLAL